MTRFCFVGSIDLRDRVEKNFDLNMLLSHFTIQVSTQQKKRESAFFDVELHLHQLSFGVRIRRGRESGMTTFTITTTTDVSKTTSIHSIAILSFEMISLSQHHRYTLAGWDADELYGEHGGKGHVRRHVRPVCLFVCFGAIRLISSFVVCC